MMQTPPNYEMSEDNLKKDNVRRRVKKVKKDELGTIGLDENDSNLKDLQQNNNERRNFQFQTTSAFFPQQSNRSRSLDFPFSAGHYSAPTRHNFLEGRMFDASSMNEFEHTINNPLYKDEDGPSPPQGDTPSAEGGTETPKEERTKSKNKKKTKRTRRPMPKPDTNIFDIRKKLERDQSGRKRFLIVGLNYECNIFSTFVDCVSYLKNTLGDRMHQNRGGHYHGIEPFWIDIQSPTPDDMEAIEKYFNLHKLTTEDCLDNDSGEKLEMFPNYLFVCVRTVDKRIENQFEELNVIIFKRFVITIHRGYFEEMEMVLKRIETEFETGLTENEKRLLYIQDIQQKYDIDRLRKKIENRPDYTTSSTSTSTTTSSVENEEELEGESTSEHIIPHEFYEEEGNNFGKNIVSEGKSEEDEEDEIFQLEKSTTEEEVFINEESESSEKKQLLKKESEKMKKRTLIIPDNKLKKKIIAENTRSLSTPPAKKKYSEKKKKRKLAFSRIELGIESPKTFSHHMVKLREKKREQRVKRKIRKLGKKLPDSHDGLDSMGLEAKLRSAARRHRKRKRQRLKLTRIPHPSWILYAFLDVMTDMYVPLTEGLLMEVESVDELVLELKEDSEKIDLLRRLGMTKKQINRMKKLLITKHSIVQLLMSNNTLRYISNETSVYLRDVVDHLNQCLIHLESAKESLNQSHSNYMIKVSIEIAKSSKQTDAVMNRITLFASILTPLALISGIWGMNVPVPGQYTTNLWWFFGIIVGMFIISGLSLIFLSPQLIPEYYGKFKRIFTCGYCRDRKKRREYENKYLSYGGE